MPYARHAGCLCICALGGWLIADVPARAQNPAPATSESGATGRRTESSPTPPRKAARIAAARRHLQKNEVNARLAAHRAAGGAPAKRHGRSNSEVANTWLIFGFTDGSDVGEKGERTLFYDSFVRATARGFAAWDSAAGIGYSPTDRAVVAFAATPSFEHNAEQVITPSGTNWMHSRGLGAVASLKYQLFRREEAPVGFAVQISPYWQHVESGPISHDTFGSEFRLLFDRVLAPSQWFAALNLAYSPYREAYSDGSALRTTAFEISAAVSRQVTVNFFLGTEIRHLSKHRGLFFNEEAGHAVYAGPTAFILLGEQGYFGIAWAARIAQDVSTGAAQLGHFDGFDRHQLRLKAGISF
jgi:hypothetical protein